MDDELDSISTEELIEIGLSKLPSISIGVLLSKLVQRALSAIQNQETELCDSEEVETVLAALYGESCFNWLMQLLISAAISVRARAGAAYLLALLTAVESQAAEELRNKVAKGCGVLRLVALLSADSVSVQFNALIAIVNLLRHCPNVHSELCRLGASRKLAVLFKQASEEPQQNVCMDAFLCLCRSNSPGVCEQLLNSGCLLHLLEWVNQKPSKRVTKKAVESIISLLDQNPTIRHATLQLNLIPPLLSLFGDSKSKELCMVSLIALRSACSDESEAEQRALFVESNGVKILTEKIQLNKDRELLMQVIQILTILAMVDSKIRQEISGAGTCLQFLHGLLFIPSNLEAKVREVNPNRGGSDGNDLSPLGKEHAAAIRLLLKVCKSHVVKEVSGCASFLPSATGWVAAT